jgi:predicted PurR-regulated permease PerM
MLLAISAGTAIRPAVDWLAQAACPELPGSLLIYLLLLAILAVIGTLIAPLIGEQFAVMRAVFPIIIRLSATGLSNRPAGWCSSSRATA